MIRLLRSVLSALLVVVSTSAWSQATVAPAATYVPSKTGLLPTLNAEFQPALGKKHSIMFELAQPGSTKIDIYTADGDLVRTLNAGELRKGGHELAWDGKDAQGVVVPDEAYVPVLSVRATDGTTTTDDPRSYSGGEVINDLRWEFRGKTEIAYTLATPARVLIRAGIKDGPMLRALCYWEPRNAGRVVQRWDGYDDAKTEYFAEHPRAWVLVVGYQLPKFSIITSGNTATTYADYRSKKGWKRPKVDMANISLQRNGKPVEPDYFLPRLGLPQLSLRIKGELPKSRHGLPLVSGPLDLVADIPRDQRWVLDTSMYEVVFFIDNAFVAEEEQGFMPITWRWVPKDPVKPGRHTATVQITGYGGHIFSSTVAFETR